MKKMLLIGVVGIGGFFLLLSLAIFVHRYQQEWLNRRIESFVKQGKTQVTAGELFTGKWDRLCLVPGNYNLVTQEELDRVLGEAGLVREAQLGHDGYELFVVEYGEKTKVYRYAPVDLVGDLSITCTSNPASQIKLGRTEGETKTLAVGFEEKFVSLGPNSNPPHEKKNLAEEFFKQGLDYSGGNSEKGIRVNPALGRIYLNKAAKLGHREAMLLLAADYEYIKPKYRDEKLAWKWYLEAAELGEPKAIERVIKVYENGELGQKVSAQEAAVWREKLPKK